jgi:hypothetical protein
VQSSFNMLDSDHTGMVDLQHMIRRYNATRHPKVISGELTAGDALKSFVESIDGGYDIDGCVTASEFERYFSNLSCVIPNEQDFDSLAKNVWIPGVPRKVVSNSRPSVDFVSKLRDSTRDSSDGGSQSDRDEFVCTGSIKRIPIPDITLPDGSGELSP